MSSKMRRFVNRLRAELDIVLIRGGGGGYSLSLNRCNLVSLSAGVSTVNALRLLMLVRCNLVLLRGFLSRSRVPFRRRVACLSLAV